MKFESSTPDLPNPADSIPTTMEDRPVKVEPSDTLNGISDCRPTSTIDSLPGLTSTMADTAVKTEQSDASHGLPRREATPSFTALDNATQLADTAVKIEPSDASYGLSRHEPTPSSAALDDVTRLAPMTADCKDEINCSQSDDNLEELPPHNFVKAFKSLQDPTLIGLPSVQPPVTSADFNRFRFDPRYSSYPHKRTVAAYVVALRNKGELPPGGHQAVQNMLKSLFRIEGLTPAIDHDYSYSWILRTIMGECGSGGSSLASKPYSFPPLLSEQASIVLDHFQDDLNIGVTAEASASPTPPTPPISADEKSGGKDRAKKPRSKKRKIETTVDDQSARPKTYDMENPTLAAMMHNIQRGKGMSRIIDPSLKRNHNRFGSNGLGVGEWWPFHICALRDGAHGSAMGGIAGSSRDGAKSIVIGGGYEGMDRDEGNIIYYSGSNSHANTDPNNAHISNGTKSLQRSMLDNRQLRVLRNASGHSQYAPAVGIRYDGLYKIVTEEKRYNMNGGAYLRFKLARQDGQPPIDLSRPNQMEKTAFAALKQ